jgi:hypothetical protein
MLCLFGVGPVRSSRFASGQTPLLALCLFVFGPGAACYETTPHRAQVISYVRDTNCVSVIQDVFARAGFVQLPTPPRLSMFFAPRVSGPYSSVLRSGTGIGVTFAPKGSVEEPGCQFDIEALSPDASCTSTEMNPAATLACDGVGPGSIDAVKTSTMCPTSMPLASCELTSVPGKPNDDAIDEMGRRLRVALGSNPTR